MLGLYSLSMDFGIYGGPLQWFFEIPPVSRLYLLGALTTTTLASLNILSPYTFYLNWNDIIHGEVSEDYFIAVDSTQETLGNPARPLFLLVYNPEECNSLILT